MKLVEYHSERWRHGQSVKSLVQMSRTTCHDIARLSCPSRLNSSAKVCADISIPQAAKPLIYRARGSQLRGRASLRSRESLRAPPLLATVSTTNPHHTHTDPRGTIVFLPIVALTAAARCSRPAIHLCVRPTHQSLPFSALAIGARDKKQEWSACVCATAWHSRVRREAGRRSTAL
jgi:hypothetical protein